MPVRPRADQVAKFVDVALTGGAFAATVANTTVKLAVDPKAVVGGFLGFVGTIGTGPSLVSVVASGKKKIV